MMIRREISKRRSIVLSILGALAFLGAYDLLAWYLSLGGENTLVIPRFVDIVSAGFESMKYDEFERSRPFFSDFWATGYRTFLSVGLSGVCGLLMGLIIGCHLPSSSFFSVPLVFLSAVPPTALLGIVLKIVGPGDAFYVSIVSVGLIPALALYTMNMVRAMNMEKIYNAYTLNAGSLKIIRKVIFPEVLPRYLNTLTVQLLVAVIILMAAEAMIGSDGVGVRIRRETKTMNLALIFFYIGALSTLAIATINAIRLVRDWKAPWFIRTEKK